MEAILKNETVMTQEEAIALAKEIERVESSLKMMKDNLKKYVDENGDVNTGEKIWGYSQSVSWKFKAKGLEELARGLVLDGRNPWEMLSISAANVKKLGWTDEVLANYGEKRSTNRFSGRKA